jgi:hypothetical protein
LECLIHHVWTELRRRFGGAVLLSGFPLPLAAIGVSPPFVFNAERGDEKVVRASVCQHDHVAEVGDADHERALPWSDLAPRHYVWVTPPERLDERARPCDAFASPGVRGSTTLIRALSYEVPERLLLAVFGQSPCSPHVPLVDLRTRGDEVAAEAPIDRLEPCVGVAAELLEADEPEQPLGRLFALQADLGLQWKRLNFSSPKRVLRSSL